MDYWLTEIDHLLEESLEDVNYPDRGNALVPLGGEDGLVSMVAAASTASPSGIERPTSHSASNCSAPSMARALATACS